MLLEFDFHQLLFVLVCLIYVPDYSVVYFQSSLSKSWAYSFALALFLKNQSGQDLGFLITFPLEMAGLVTINDPHFEDQGISLVYFSFSVEDLFRKTKIGN